VKYICAYKTSDGTRHEDVIHAASREEVFAQLRAKGIRAIKVIASDGSKANGEIRGVRKRIVIVWVVFSVILTGVVAICLFPKSGEKIPRSFVEPAPQATMKVARPLARQTINGDRHRIGEAVHSLTNVAERYLAQFAEPGRVWEQDAALPAEAEFVAIINEPIRYAENEFTEAVDLKRIIAKIKADLKAYLAEGGTVNDYLGELCNRQKMEVAYREKAERNLARLLAVAFPRQAHSPQTRSPDAEQAAYDYWLKSNAQLQSMGIAPLPLPNQLRVVQSSLDLDE